MTERLDPRNWPALDAGYITTHFSLAELTRSDIAERYGLSNEPGVDELRNLRRLAGLLEYLREVHLGACPVLVSSGFRSRQVNTIVGGSETSAHMHGLAADFIVPSVGSPLQVCHHIAAALPDAVDQLIFEGTWVHIGLAREGAAPRRQLLTKTFRKGLKPTYQPGLPA